jgi:ABC-type lipoprotein export system ATPase subunit
MGGKEGIHIIALLDPSCGRVDIEGLLGALGLNPGEFGKSSSLVQKDPINVIDIIHKRGGLSVLAHANSSKGALNDMSGQQRIKLITFPLLHAAEGTDFQNADLQAKHKRVVDLLDGTDPSYKRKLAVYQASDNPSGSTSGEHGISGIGSRCAYFKLDRINLDGLRQCFADPDVRIRQDYECSTSNYPRVKSVRITGGFLDGSEAVFHEGLNSILGAKGAGKSLLVELLRFGLDQPPINEDILHDHDAKLEKRLEDYGVVEVTITDETGKDLTLKRTYNPADDSPYSPDVHYNVAQMFPILFLSQNEIINIAESEQEQISFIDRFFDFRSYQAEIKQLENRLRELDVEVAECIRAQLEVKEIEKAVATANAEVVKLDEALKNPVFDEFAKLEAKDRAFREQTGYVSSVIERIKLSRKDLQDFAPPALPQALADDPALRRTADQAAKARQSMSTRIDELLEDLGGIQAKMQGQHEAWAPTFKTGKKNYEEAVQREGGDYKILAQKRARKVKDLEGLAQRLAATKEKSGRLKEKAGQRSSLLKELQGSYQRYTQERRERCKTIEEESAGRLQVNLHESSNVDEFRNRLRSLKRGSHFKDTEIDKICATVTPAALVKGLINFVLSNKADHLEEIVKKSDLSAERIRGLAEFLIASCPYEHLLSLPYEAMPEDRPEIRYNIGDNTYEPLKSLSVGQKCTAMLIISLSDGSMPIIIDQPEDSLDIRSVWDDICLKIRRGKEHRQFIFTTHNSSLAVASDTDKFTIVEGGATHGRVVFSGSMDHPPISDEVIKYLEGGIQTYRRKFDKYRADQKLG